MRSNNSTSTIWLFLLGVFAETKVYFFGCLAISEMIVFIIAPIIFLIDYKILVRDKFIGFCWMVFGLMGALFLSSYCNNTAMPFIIKSFAVMYAVFAYFVVFHRFLRGNFKALGWFFVGAFISSIITIFALNPTAVVSEAGYGYVGNTDVDAVVSGPLFWTSRLRALLNVLVCGFYYAMPISLSVALPLSSVVITIATTISGRASSIAFILTSVIIAVGRKSRRAMYGISKHLWIFLFSVVVVLFLVKQMYQYAASKGMMGDAARSKYEAQTRKGSGMLSLLMSGRTEFFVSFRAVFSKPILGYGPWAEDTEGFWLMFVKRYGDETDIVRVENAMLVAQKQGSRILIPSHSHIMGAWLHYGLFGFIFYCWILFLIYRHFKSYMGAIPQWYGFFAAMVPYYMWNIFFSAFGSRWMFALLMTCLFYARAVGQGLILLPYDMELEARKYD